MKEGFLTTHVLDIYSGKPGSNIKVDLYSLIKKRKKIITVILNKDGRSLKPLISGNNFKKGKYELIFYVGNYFKKKQKISKKMPFLDEVVVRFGISNNNQYR